MKTQRILLLAVCLIMTCCESRMTPISTVPTGNPGQTAALLLEVDGCKVYRFIDGNRAVYFSTCKGKVSYDYTTSSGSGKARHSTTHHVESLTDETPNE